MTRRSTGLDNCSYEYSTSANGGMTWAPTKYLTATTVGSNTPAYWYGVDPGLTLLPNGILVMAGGRPDNNIAVSRGTLSDGTPRWVSKQVIYSNYPTQGQAIRLRGSSGYEGITPIGSSRMMIAVDNCGPDPWGCPTTSWGWTQSSTQKLMKIYLDASTGAIGTAASIAHVSSGKLDLNGMLRSRKAMLTKNDFTATNSKHPTLRTLGAFDGSADYWSSALSRTGKPATMTIRLDQKNTLTKVGLSLQPGLSGNAEVRYSVDGTRWTSPGKVSQTHSHSIQYYGLPSGTQARYVQVVVQPSKVCASGIRTGSAMLNELELYS
jgi:hypothetical protein